MAEDPLAPPGDASSDDSAAPLDLPGLDFSLDSPSPAKAEEETSASGSSPADLGPPLDLPSLDTVESTAGESGTSGSPPPLDLPGLDFPLESDSKSDGPGPPPAPPGGSDDPVGLPSFDPTSLGDSVSPESKDELPSLDLDDLPSLDLDGPKPEPSGETKDEPSEKGETFLDETPAAGETLGFSSADDVLALDSNVEDSVLDETEPEADMPKVSTISRKKLMMGLGAGVLLCAVIFGGLYTIQHSVRETLKGWVAKSMIQEVSTIKVSGGLNRKALVSAFALLDQKVVPNKGVSIADIQTLKVHYERFSEDNTLDMPEFMPLESLIQALAEKRPPR